MLEELDNAVATAKDFLAAEDAHFQKTRNSLGNRHRNTDEAHARVVDAKAKIKVAEELSEKNHRKVDQARIERHEAFEVVQQKMDAVWSMDGVSMERALFKAAMEEDAQMIGRLLEAGVDTNCRNTGGQTPLELAATRGKLHSLFLLLDEDGSGEISKSELRQLGRAVGVELSDKDIKPLMAVLDNDGGGSIDLDEFSDDYSRSFLANFLAKISPTGFGWVEEEIQRMERLESMLQKKLDADKAEREALKVYASKAAGVIASKAAKAAAKKAAEDAAAAAEAIAREELRNVLMQCVNEGATNLDGMKTVLAKLEGDDRRETDTTPALLERWKARLKQHRERQELADAREREREAQRRAKADREAAEALCDLEPDVFAERLEMVMRRVADFKPPVLEPEGSTVLRQAAGHAGDAITELTRRRVRQDTEASAVEAAIVLQTTPPGTSLDERQNAFRDALATALDGVDAMRFQVTGMGPAESLAPTDPKYNSRPPATPGWLRVSFRVLEPYGREVDDGAASSEALLHRLDELAVDGGGLEEAMQSIGGLVRYEPDKHAAARAQSREKNALAVLSANNSNAERAAAEAKAEEEKRAACQPIPLPFRRVTYAMIGSQAAGPSSTGSTETIQFDHSSVWLWYYIQGSEKWSEKDRQGVRRVVFKYRRLRFGGGHEGIDDEPEPESELEPAQANSEAEGVAAKDRARQKRKQRKAALSDPVKAAFDQYDVDKSGTLDVGEVTALLHDRGFRMSAAELEGVFEAIDDDGNGVLDLSELRKMWTFLGMHMAARGTAREHATSEDDTEEEDTVSASGGLPPSAAPGVDTTGWCALSGPAVKCEDGWWRSCDWPLAPGFEHSVWIDGQMVGTFHDPALVVTAPPNVEDAEEEEDGPIVMVTKVGSRTVTTVVAKARDSDEEGDKESTGAWRRRKKKGPRHYSFDPVAGLLADQQFRTSATAGIPGGSNTANSVVAELHRTMPRGNLIISIDRCTGLQREKAHRTDGVFCVVAANNSGLARRSGTVYESGRTLSWKGHHGTIVFSGLDAPPSLLHIFVLRRAPAAFVAAAAADSGNAASRRSTRSTQAVRAALVEIYTTHNPGTYSC